MRNLLTIAAIALMPGVALATEWFENDYNPIPMDDDIILPMPCDGRMVFRNVETNLISDVKDGAFADRSIRLGWDGARDSAYREGEWKSYVAGGLIDDRSRYYLIGKYELTDDQVNAIMSPDCDDSDVDFGTPFTKMTWFDAIKISHLYSLWLHSNAADDLPVSVGTTAYVRPPTEAEWEFAARGGLEVSDSERRNERFPMDGPLAEYAFYSGDGVSNGDLQYIGKKRANPLGLFDVYGNAFEIVFDPFRLNKAGRMHGHFGAMTIKGGSVRSDAREIRSGTRQEVPLYNTQVTGSIARRSDVGIRLVISGVSTGDQQHSDILASSWDSLVGDSTIDVGQPPVQLLRNLADESDDTALRNSLNSIAADIENNLRERDELEVQALENLLQSATLMIYRISGLYKSIEQMRHLRAHSESRSETALTNETDSERRERLRLVTAYDNNIEDFCRFSEIYTDTFLQLVTDYSREQVLTVARGLRAELELQERGLIVENLSFLGRSLLEFDDSETWASREQIKRLLRLSRRNPEISDWVECAMNQN